MTLTYLIKLPHLLIFNDWGAVIFLTFNKNLNKDILVNILIKPIFAKSTAS